MVKYKKMTFAIMALVTVLGCGAIFPLSGASAVSCPTAESLAVEGEVSSEPELRYAMLGNNDISEVKVNTSFTITCTNVSYTDLISKDFTIDLNGETVTSQLPWAFDIETSGKTLTIKDTSEEGSGTYVFNEGGFWVDAGANLTIESGNIRSVEGGRRAILFNGGGKLTVNGGIISTTPQKTSDGNGRTVLVYNSTFEMNGGEISVAKAEGGENGVGVLYLQNSQALINSGKITANDGGAFRAIGGSNITMKSGEIVGKNEVVSLTDSGFVMDDGLISADGVAVFTGKNGSFTMNNGAVTSKDSYAIAGNGSVDSEGEPLYGGTTWTLNGGKVVSEGLTAIYQPQVGETTLGEKLQVMGGKAGVEVRAGDLTIEGATVVVTGEDAYAVIPNGNGATTTGAAVAVAQHTTRKPIEVSITKGTFIGPVAFSEADPQDGEPVSVTLGISGGAFVGNIVSENNDKEDFVTGGDFMNWLEAADGKASISIDGSVVAKSELGLNIEGINDLSGFTLSESEDKATLVTAYNINLMDSEGVVRVSKNDGVKMTIYVKLTNEQYEALKAYEKVVVVYFNENKEEERIEAELQQMEDGSWFAVFETDHLSTYGVAGIESEEGGSGTPETGTMTAAGASAANAAIVTAIAVGLLTSIVSFAYLIRRR